LIAITDPERDYREAARELVATFTDGELRQALRDVERELAPAGPAEAARTLRPLIVAFPVGAGEDAAARVALYSQALQDEPAACIAEAVEGSIRTLRFFPRVAELLEGCERAKLKLHRRKAAILKAMQPEPEPKRESVGRIPVPPEVLSAPSWAEKSSRLGGYTPPRPTETRQEMAERLRRHAEAM